MSNPFYNSFLGLLLLTITACGTFLPTPVEDNVASTYVQEAIIALEELDANSPIDRWEAFFTQRGARTFWERLQQEERATLATCTDIYKREREKGWIIQLISDDFLSRPPQTTHWLAFNFSFTELSYPSTRIDLEEQANEVAAGIIRYLVCYQVPVKSLTFRSNLLQGSWLTLISPEIGLLSTLEEFILSDNGLVEIPAEIFNIPNLKKLYLNRNQLTTIPLVSCEFSSLRILNLACNQLSTIPPAIRELISLQVLDLRSNQIREISPEISNLTNLVALNLNNNSLTTIPSNLFKLTSLKGLSLRGNQLTEVSPEIVKLSNLKGINLANNQLSAISSELGKLRELEILLLWENHITTISPETVNLNKLKHLHLGVNSISEAPPEIFNLSSLIELDLDLNESIEKISPEIAKLTNLTRLNLSGNQLTELPSAIGELTGLNNLDLSRNQLTELPFAIREVTSLSNLDISYNQLTKLPVSIFPILNRLQSCSLWPNPWIDPSVAFSCLEKLDDEEINKLICQQPAHSLLTLCIECIESHRDNLKVLDDKLPSELSHVRRFKLLKEVYVWNAGKNILCFKEIATIVRPMTIGFYLDYLPSTPQFLNIFVPNLENITLYKIKEKSNFSEMDLPRINFSGMDIPFFWHGGFPPFLDSL
jgi:Leucine-rich repeat (LRR) protein